MGAVIGEWLGSSSGLGVYLTRSSHSFLSDRVFAAIFMITALSFLYYALISTLILLSDKVVVLSQRPARIIHEFKIPFPHPRDPEDLLLSNVALDLKRQLLHLLIP